MAPIKFRSSRETSMIRTAMSALGLLVIIPGLVIFYIFREHLAGNELVLGLVLLVAALGFSLLFTIVRAITAVQRGLQGISDGDLEQLNLKGGPTQLREMTEIINALNSLTIEFRENAAQLESFIRQFATLAELTEVTAKVPDIHELLGLVLMKAMSASQARRGTVMLLREEDKTLEIVSTEGWTPEAQTPIALHETLAARVIESGQPLLIRDIDDAHDIDQLNDASRYSSPSFLIMPLKAKTLVLGAVCLSEKYGGEFTESDKQFLTVMLGQIGFAVENARLLKQAREAATNLKARVRHQEIEIQDARGRIQQAEKLSALGQLAGGVAHDFNNMLQAILGYTKIARKGLPDREKRACDLDEVKKAAEKAATLTAQLLAFGRRQVLQPVDMDVNETIHEMLKMLRRLIGEHVELETDLDADLRTVHADPRQIEQVLMNLCLNARDAMPEGGSIGIRTRNLEIGEEFCQDHPWAQPGSYVEFSVKDTGCGMDRETLDQVFEPFFTTKEVGKGTGLGLATVYGIVKQHNGLIDVSSEIGRGSEFCVCLPVVDRPARSVERRARAAQPEGGSETILVAEDEATVRALNISILEEAGYEVLPAEDGAAAVELFNQHADRVSLALIDAVMPKLSGREVYEQIKKIKPDIRVLFSSGYSADAISTGFIQVDDLPLMHKPFDPDDLLRRVREILDTVPAQA